MRLYDGTVAKNAQIGGGAGLDDRPPPDGRPGDQRAVVDDDVATN